MTARPQLGIGLPVFNGANFVSEAIDSILGQTFGDFNLVIADNASTDATEEICREFASRDRRIRYFRHDRNLGASANHDFVFNEARARYFKLAAHDDVLKPTFLERCLEALEADGSIVLAWAKTMSIDESGKPLVPMDTVLQQMDSPRPSDRFGTVIIRRSYAVPIFGVIRRDVLPGSVFLGTYVGSDRTTLAHLALKGPWYLVPEYLLMRRDHAHNSTKDFRGEFNRLAWFDPSRSIGISFPTWRRLYEYGKVVHEADLDPGERRAAYVQVAKWLLTGYPLPKWALLVRDPLVVGMRMLNGAMGRSPADTAVS